MHANRHSKAAHVDATDPASAEMVNPETHRRAKVVEKDDGLYIVVVDQQGELVTKFQRRPTQGGLVGALEYLLRGGYKEE